MDSNEIKAVIQTYFDAGYECNGEKMREAFHSGAHVYGHNEDGTLNDMDKEAFIKLVESGKPGIPESAYPRHDEIISIDFTGVDTAVAQVKLRVGNIMFTDILSFIRLDTKWSIISKLYAGVPVSD